MSKNPYLTNNVNSIITSNIITIIASFPLIFFSFYILFLPVGFNIISIRNNFFATGLIFLMSFFPALIAKLIYVSTHVSQISSTDMNTVKTKFSIKGGR